MGGRRKGVRQISEIANGLIDPILARRAGIDTTLIGSWDEIAGPDFADCSRPEEIRWDRRRNTDAVEFGGFVPGMLTVACDGARALFLMHAKDELIQRINAFFGYPAIDRVRIVQKPVGTARPKPPQRPPSADEIARLHARLADIEDVRLRAALERLGRSVLMSGRGR